MKLNQINIYKVDLPLSGDFSHSLRKATSANGIMVEVIAEQGEITGYGEGAPRVYVTGETQESATEALSHFLRQESFPWELNDVSQIWSLVENLPNGGEYNSAICALEMSLLDALGRSQNKPIIEYFPRDFYTSKVYYGAGIPISSKLRKTEICQLIKKLNINKIRLKMGKDLEENSETFEITRSILGDESDLKIDANCAWDRDLAFKHIPLIEHYRVKVVEQPMMPDDPDIAEFAEAIQNCGAVLTADESVCSLRDIDRILEEGNYKMVNVRLSKCGGMRNSLRLIEHVRKDGLSFQIAAHVGESGLLSAAGRALSLLCRDAAYYEGSYDAFVLKENITVENVSFGLGGEAGPLPGPGLGVVVNTQNLKRLSTDCVRIRR